MNDQPLGERLRDALPTRPATTGWGRAARRRSAGRRAAAGGLGVVAVAALLVPLAINLGGGQSTVNATPTPDPSSTAGPDALYPLETFGAAACRSDGGTVPQGSDLTDGKLPEGATAVWLCGSGTPEEKALLGVVGIHDGLRVGAAEAVAAFNELTWRQGAMIDCASGGEGYAAVFEYPDGTSKVLRGLNTPNGCDHFDNPSGIIEGASGYLETLRDLWQRERAEHPVVTKNLHVCPASTAVWQVDPADLTKGYACGGGDVDARRQARLDDSLARDLAAVLGEAKEAGADAGDTAAMPGAVLLTDHNDPVTVYLDDDGDRPRLLVRSWSGTRAADLTRDLADRWLAAAPKQQATPSQSVGEPPRPQPSAPETTAPAQACPTNGNGPDLADPDVWKRPPTGDIVVCEYADNALARAVTLTPDVEADLRREFTRHLEDYPPSGELFRLDVLISSRFVVVIDGEQRLFGRTGEVGPTTAVTFSQGREYGWMDGTPTYVASQDLTARLWAELTGGSCEPHELTPQEVRVDVYDAGAGAADVAAAVDFFLAAGFDARDSGQKAEPSMNTPAYVRSSPEGLAMHADLVGSYLKGGAGEMSGKGSAIDVVLTGSFDPERDLVLPASPTMNWLTCSQ